MTSTPDSRSAASASRVLALTGSAIARRPSDCLPRATKTTVSPRARSSSAAALGLADRDAVFGHEARAAQPQGLAIEGGLHATARDRREAVHRARRDCALPGMSKNGLRQRMFARRLQACRGGQQFRLVRARGGAQRGDARLAFGERTGLVDDERVDLLHELEAFGVADQHPRLRPAPDPDHDRHRRREAERARARDDEHGHRNHQRVGPLRFRSEHRPDDRSDDGNADHGRHEPP